MAIGTAIAMQRQELNAAQAWALVEAHRISVVPIFDGRLWFASADVLGTKHNKSRAIASVDAHGITCLDAVCALAKKLEVDE